MENEIKKALVISFVFTFIYSLISYCLMSFYEDSIISIIFCFPFVIVFIIGFGLGDSIGYLFTGLIFFLIWYLLFLLTKYILKSRVHTP